MDEAALHRFTKPVSATTRTQIVEHELGYEDFQEPVRRQDGSSISLAVADDLMQTATPRFYDADWTDRTVSDRWLAPRLHYSLRLTRAQAADRNLWAWLATRYSAYVTWRWSNTESSINEDRWNGPVHKQALMRLWWGAELFRNGPDYTPAARAFLRQDLPNSYLHRPLVRCRSLALALVDVVAPITGDSARSSDEINDLARVLNLAMAGSPPELETDFQRDDHRAYQAWVQEVPKTPNNWDEELHGPAASDTTSMSLAGGRAIAERGWGYAVNRRAESTSA